MARTTWIVLLIVLVVAGAGIGAGLAFTGSSTGTSGHGSPQVAAILSSPQSYYGIRVRVRGSVNAVYGKSSFTLGQGTEQGLLVALASRSAKKAARLNSLVVVTGVVRSFTAAAYAKWAGDASNPAGVLTTFEGKPAVFATGVQRVR